MALPSDPDAGPCLLACRKEELVNATVRAPKPPKAAVFIRRDIARTDEEVANPALPCRLNTI